MAIEPPNSPRGDVEPPESPPPDAGAPKFEDVEVLKSALDVDAPKFDMRRILDGLESAPSMIPASRVTVLSRDPGTVSVATEEVNFPAI